MAMISITPWRKRDELLEVRSWLYAGGEHETRRKACSQVSSLRKIYGVTEQPFHQSSGIILREDRLVHRLLITVEHD